MRLTLAFGSCCFIGILTSLEAGLWLAPFLALVAYAILVELPERVWNGIVVAMLAGAIAVAAFAVAQVATGLPRALGPFGSPNSLGFYAVLHVGLALAWRSRWPRIAVTAGWTSAIAIILSGSRASLLSLAAMFILPRARRYPVMAFAAAFAAIASVAVIPGHEGDLRLLVWRVGASLALNHPLTGWGIGRVIVLDLPSFYNVALDWTVATGFVGLAAGIWLAVEMWLAGPPLRPFMIGWLVNGLFMYSTPETSLALLVAIGWLGSGRGLNIAQRAVGHDGQDTGAADLDRGAEGELPDLARLGE